MSRPDGYTRVSALGPLADFVERRGGSIGRVFSRADLPLALLDDPNLPLPLREQFKVLRETGREIGDGYAGAQLGQCVSLGALSGFGRWAGGARTLGGAIHRCAIGLNRYLQTGTALRLKVRDDVAAWSIEFFDPGDDGRLQNELLGISYLIDGVRGYSGPRWRPRLIRTTGARAGQRAALERIFDAPVSVGHARCAVEFDPALLAISRPAPFEAARRDRQAASMRDEPALPSGAEAREAVAALAAIALLEGYPKIDWVAGKLDMSRRSLQRRLGEEGARFSAVLEDVLRDKAIAALRRPDRTATAVAFSLGFSDAAHFTRAFRRWTGQTPAEFRRRNGSSGAASGARR